MASKLADMLRGLSIDKKRHETGEVTDPWDYYSYLRDLHNPESVVKKALRLYRVWLTGQIALSKSRPALLENRKAANFWILLHFYRIMKEDNEVAAKRYTDMVATCLAAEELRNKERSPCLLRMITHITDQVPECKKDIFNVGEKLLPAFHHTCPTFTPEVDDKIFINAIENIVGIERLAREMEHLAVGPRPYRAKNYPNVDIKGYHFFLKPVPVAPECVLVMSRRVARTRSKKGLSYMLMHFVKQSASDDHLRI